MYWGSEWTSIPEGAPCSRRFGEREGEHPIQPDHVPRHSAESLRHWHTFLWHPNHENR
jgi:hypothetical protein